MAIIAVTALVRVVRSMSTAAQIIEVSQNICNDLYNYHLRFLTMTIAIPFILLL